MSPEERAEAATPTWDPHMDGSVSVDAALAELATVRRERDEARASVSAGDTALDIMMDWQGDICVALCVDEMNTREFVTAEVRRLRSERDADDLGTLRGQVAALGGLLDEYANHALDSGWIHLGKEIARRTNEIVKDDVLKSASVKEVNITGMSSEAQVLAMWAAERLRPNEHMPDCPVRHRASATCVIPLAVCVPVDFPGSV